MSCSGSSAGRRLSFGAEVVAGDAIAFALEGSPKYVTTKDAVIEAGAVVLATGRPMPKERLIAGEDRLIGQGVSYCATCDGPLFRGASVAAVGHGEDALEDVHALHTMGIKVLWVPGKEGGAADSPGARDLESRGVTIRREGRIREIRGEAKVESVVIETAAGPEVAAVAAVFIFREIPAGPLFERAGVALDHKQCVAVDRFQRTNIPGVLAAGDITCGGLQVVSAAGEGCVAGNAGPRLPEEIRSISPNSEVLHSALLRISSLAPAPRKPANPVSPAFGGSPFHHGGFGTTSIAAISRTSSDWEMK